MEGNDFNVFRVDNLDGYAPFFGRKDLYRICLVNGKSRINYNDQSVGISGSYLFFGNVNTPYSWETESNKQQGYSCLFTKEFLKGAEFAQNFREYSPFRSANIPLYVVKNKKQFANIEFIFERMLTVYNSDYCNQRDMIKSLINLLMHEALTIRPYSKLLEGDKETTKSSRKISLEFQNLLDAQFPVENKKLSVEMTMASHFADKLGVHPNYLNRAIKRDTGKTALKHINERIITEAKILLEHSDWTISEISFCLGFEYHSYFDNVFKKITGLTPKAYRDRFNPIVILEK
ncbi:helix-turn-helix domain-containing protein [uncultured Sphingobacterium sp.]|uniref:helix-turn-helix domain-containing protein n=1 Tax=uncultured Sphingobacterium sp. TaxID=182688 RepID=UPI003749BCF5